MVLGEVRKRKSEARRPLNTRVRRAMVADEPHRLDALEHAVRDVRAAGAIDVLELRPGAPFEVEIELADPVVEAETTAGQ
jgi:hypothetical protein